MILIELIEALEKVHNQILQEILLAKKATFLA